MEEKKMQELNMDEIVLDMLMGGWAYCYCEKCGHKAIGPY